MSSRSFRLSAAALTFLGFGAGCGGGGIEGKYYNSVTGAFAFELNDGQALNAEGQPGPMPMNYMVRGDSVYLAPPGVDPSQAIAFAIKPGGILESEAGSLKKQ